MMKKSAVETLGDEIAQDLIWISVMFTVPAVLRLYIKRLSVLRNYQRAWILAHTYNAIPVTSCTTYNPVTYPKLITHAHMAMSTLTSCKPYNLVSCSRFSTHVHNALPLITSCPPYNPVTCARLFTHLSNALPTLTSCASYNPVIYPWLSTHLAMALSTLHSSATYDGRNFTMLSMHGHKTASTVTTCTKSQGFPCKEVKPIPKSDLGVKIALCGGGGRLGQFLAFLLKLSPLIKQINLFDLKDTYGIVTDLNHINTRCKVKAYFGPKQLKRALKEMDIVLLMAGKTWRPGMNTADLFHVNVGTVRSLAEATAHFCPEAIMGVITGPINCFVPLINEVYKRVNKYNPDKVIGMMTYEVMKANAIVANTHYLDPSSIHVPVIGGASDVTVVPLLSLARPYSEFSKEVVLKLAEMIRSSDQKATQELGRGPSMSGGYAAARFALTLVRGLCQQQDAVMSAYVRSNSLPHCKYFANQLQFGPDGVVKNFGIPKLSVNETALLEQAIPEILQDIKLAEDYMRQDAEDAQNEAKSRKLQI